MAGWNDPAEFMVAGTGQVHVAPVGTPLPATAEAALNAAFYGLGFHTEDGVSMNLSVEIVDIKSWQSAYATRRIRESEEFMLSFALQQWQEVNVPFAFGGGDIIDLGSDQWRYSPPAAGDALDERALVCDVVDGDRIGRWIIPRGSVTEGIETQFTRAATADLPVSFKALQPDAGGDSWYVLFNDDAAYTAGS